MLYCLAERLINRRLRIHQEYALSFRTVNTYYYATRLLSLTLLLHTTIHVVSATLSLQLQQNLQEYVSRKENLFIFITALVPKPALIDGCYILTRSAWDAQPTLQAFNYLQR